MSLSIRLSRGGSKKRPYYHIVVADARSPRDGKYIERLGNYDPRLPKDSDERVKLDAERAKHWIAAGAQPSDRVSRFLDAAGVIERKVRNNPKKGEPGSNAKDRAEEKAAKLAEAQEAAAAAAAAPAPEPEVVEVAEAPAAEVPVAEAPAEEEPAAEAPTEEAAAPEAPAIEEAAPAQEAPVAAETTAEEKAEG